MAPFSNIQSSRADQYGSIDIWNIKIRPLVIILWQNILGQQHIALNSLLTTLPHRIFYCKVFHSLILYCSRIRKNDNRQRIENTITEDTLIPVDRRGERTNRVFPPSFIIFNVTNVYVTYIPESFPGKSSRRNVYVSILDFHVLSKFHVSQL